MSIVIVGTDISLIFEVFHFSPTLLCSLLSQNNGLWQTFCVALEKVPPHVVSDYPNITWEDHYKSVPHVPCDFSTINAAIAFAVETSKTSLADLNRPNNLTLPGHEPRIIVAEGEYYEKLELEFDITIEAAASARLGKVVLNYETSEPDQATLDIQVRSNECHTESCNH